MNDQSEMNDARPYSAPMCVLMLLGTGIAVKIGAALHLGQTACGLAP